MHHYTDWYGAKMISVKHEEVLKFLYTLDDDHLLDLSNPKESIFAEFFNHHLANLVSKDDRQIFAHVYRDGVSFYDLDGRRPSRYFGLPKWMIKFNRENPSGYLYPREAIFYIESLVSKRKRTNKDSVVEVVENTEEYEYSMSYLQTLTN